MAKKDDSGNEDLSILGGSALNKIEIPIPPESLKTGLRLVIDIKETRVRLQVDTLVRWS
jgi:hypothetical protein